MRLSCWNVSSKVCFCLSVSEPSSLEQRCCVCFSHVCFYLTFTMKVIDNMFCWVGFIVVFFNEWCWAVVLVDMAQCPYESKCITTTRVFDIEVLWHCVYTKANIILLTAIFDIEYLLVLEAGVTQAAIVVCWVSYLYCFFSRVMLELGSFYSQTVFTFEMSTMSHVKTLFTTVI